MILSLCSGYGGLDRAASAVFGVPVGWHAETDDAAKLVLDKRYDGVPNLGDVKIFDWTELGSLVTLLCAGFPCQPFSAAGRQLGESDERYLWPAVRDAIRLTQPPWVVLENVSNLVAMRKGEVWRMVLADLRSLGYAVTWGVFGACLDAVQGCHHRHRVFAVARRLPTRERPAEAVRWPGKACGVPRRGKTMLPTPAARDGDPKSRGEGDAAYWADRGAERTNGMPLGAAVALEMLPTPQHANGRGHAGSSGAEHAAQRLAEHRRNLDDAIATLDLLPTPAAVSYGSNQSGAAGRVGPVRHSLEAMARLELLPSPTVNDSRGGRNATATRSAGAASTHHSGTTLSDLAFAELLPTPSVARGVQPEHFGRYAAAVARWSAVHGLPPAPTEVGPKGGTRMTAAFPEWMMGLAPGFVSDVVGRTDALRLVGNGVFPLQAYHALSTLLAMHDG